MASYKNNTGAVFQSKSSSHLYEKSFNGKLKQKTFEPLGKVARIDNNQDKSEYASTAVNFLEQIDEKGKPYGVSTGGSRHNTSQGQRKAKPVSAKFPQAVYKYPQSKVQSYGKHSMETSGMLSEKSPKKNQQLRVIKSTSGIHNLHPLNNYTVVYKNRAMGSKAARNSTNTD